MYLDLFAGLYGHPQQLAIGLIPSIVSDHEPVPQKSLVPLKAQAIGPNVPSKGALFTTYLISTFQNGTSLIKTVSFDQLLFCWPPDTPLTHVYLLHFQPHQKQQYQSILSPPLLTISSVWVVSFPVICPADAIS